MSHLSDAIEAVSMAAVLNSFGLEPPERGRTKCPLCSSHNKSTFSVSEKTKGYFCFKCGVHGGVIDLVCRLGGLSKREAAHHISELVGMELEDAVLESDKENLRRKKQLIQEARALLRERDLLITDMRRCESAMILHGLRREADDLKGNIRRVVEALEAPDWLKSHASWTDWRACLSIEADLAIESEASSIEKRFGSLKLSGLKELHVAAVHSALSWAVRMVKGAPHEAHA